LLAALSFCIFFGVLIPLLKLPAPDRTTVVVVPERLVSLMKKEPPKPELQPERLKEEKAPEKDQAKEDRPKPTTAETQAARKKAENTGVLAFKENFKDLMAETPVAGLGAKARLRGAARPGSPGAAAGQGRAGRSIIAMQSTAGSSGGISNAGVSRNVGSGNSDHIGGVGFTRVESTVAGLAEEKKPLNSGPGPARTDEEIQIVFDKYKATLYRIYNAELRKNPTLRGKIILRITIDPSGEVSACTVQSTDLASSQLTAQIVERIKKFNFGPKEKVGRTTILYPIDFLPGS
jgi:outer membrane biosynthesis protein TonB